jgi:hypothetical protein
MVEKISLLVIKEEHRFEVFENGVLRRLCGSSWRKYQEAGEICILRSFVICILPWEGMRWVGHVA